MTSVSVPSSASSISSLSFGGGGMSLTNRGLLVRAGSLILGNNNNNNNSNTDNGTSSLKIAPINVNGSNSNGGPLSPRRTAPSASSSISSTTMTRAGAQISSSASSTSPSNASNSNNINNSSSNNKNHLGVPVSPTHHRQVSTGPVHDVLKCHNCEQIDARLSVWCMECFNDSISDDKSDIIVLCSTCDSGLHTPVKLQKHKRVPYHASTSKLNSNEERELITLIGVNVCTLVCANCEKPNITLWCSDCLLLLCKECSKDLHMPKNKKMHVRYPFSRRFVHMNNHTGIHRQALSPPSSTSTTSRPSSPKLNNVSFTSPNNNNSVNIALLPSSVSVGNPRPRTMERKFATNSTNNMNNSSNTPTTIINTTNNINMITMNTSISKPSTPRSSQRPPSSSSSSSLPIRRNTLNGAIPIPLSTQPSPQVQVPTTLTIVPKRNLTVQTSIQGDVLYVSEVSTDGDIHPETLVFRNTFNTFDHIGGVQITSISTGRQHAGAVTAYGTLFMWGSNQDGQLGIPSSSSSSSSSSSPSPSSSSIANELNKEYKEPVLIPFPNKKQVKQLACGYDHNLALTFDGEVYSWGSGLMGVLGHESDQNLEVPTKIQFPNMDSSGGERVIFVAAGQHNSGCIVRGRRDRKQMYLWGAGQCGQMGNGERETRLTPVCVKLDIGRGGDNPIDRLPDLTWMSFGQQHTVVVTMNGECWTWGGGEFGQLGYSPSSSLSSSLPSNKPPSPSHAANNTNGIASPSNYNNTSNPFNNTNGNNPPSASTPTAASSNSRISRRQQSMYLSPSSVPLGELQLVPRCVDYLRERGIFVIQAACGEIHTSVLTRDGSVYSFGSGETHQLGIWDNEDKFTPVKADTLGGDNVTPDKHAIYLAVGISMSGVVCESGDVYTWGYSVDTPVPTVIKGLRSNHIQRLAIGDQNNFICLTGVANEVYEWKFQSEEDEGEDDNDNNSSNDNDNHNHTTENKEKNIPVLNTYLRGKRIRSLSVGKHNQAAATHSGELLIWNLDKEHHSTAYLESEEPRKPIQLRVSHTISVVKCSQDHSVALSDDGRVYTWGSGDMGRLGHGNSADHMDPTCVTALEHTRVTHIAIGPHNTGCVTHDFKAYVWGGGAGGQIGNNSVLPVFSPLEIGSSNSNLASQQITSLAFGNRHAACLTIKGSCYTWGDNQMAQCGLGELSSSHPFSTMVGTPQHVDFLNHEFLVQIECGDNTTIVLTREGSVWAWGSGETKLIPGRTEDVATPTKVNFPFHRDNNNVDDKAKFIKEISVGGINAAAIASNGHVWVWGWAFDEEPRLVSSLANNNVKCNIISVGPNDILLST